MYKLVCLLFFITFCTAINEDENTSESSDYESQESLENDENNEVVLKIVRKSRNSLETDEHVEESSNELKRHSSKLTKRNKCKYRGNIADEENDKLNTLMKYAFSASIQRKGMHYATGALVNKRWILSVAREFYSVRESIKLFRARLGSDNCKRGGVSLRFKSITIHPSYSYGRPNFDLALLRLGESVNITKIIKPIPLSKITDDTSTTKFRTTYWPRIIVNGKILPESAKERNNYTSMRISSQEMIPMSECKKTMKIFNERLTNSSLCLTPIKINHSDCMPDAGAPVIAVDGLWGITSSWIPKDCPANPGPIIFTRVSLPPVRSWLEANLSI